MTDRSRARLAWGLLAVYVPLSGVAFLFGALTDDWGNVAWLVIFLPFPIVGAVVASRAAGGPIGWICLAIGFGVSATAVVDGYSIYALRTNPGSVPGGAYAALFGTFSWVLFIGLIGVFFVAFFPDGTLPSPRWRPLPWIAGAGIGLACAAALLVPGVQTEDTPVPFENPIGIGGAKPVLAPLFFVGVLTLLACILVSLASIVVRFRRSHGEQRQQLKWFVSAALFTVTIFFLGFPASLFSDALAHALEVASVLAWATLPIAAGFAILRYRLYDIDVVINKAVVFGALAAFITAVYVAIVAGVGALVGSAGHPSIPLSILATAVVAVAFQPARERAQRLANRLVYGKRATPYEVLAEFSEQAATTTAPDEVLQRMARAIAEGTGAERSDVWVKSGAELRLAASWPAGSTDGRRLALDDGRLPELPAGDRAVPVRHHDELLGALAVAKPRGESLTAGEDKLLTDLAAQAGLVLRNVGLTAELLARLEELRASRQRLVTAQDEERRRLERNLHDGAQQHLVGLKVKLNLVTRQAEDASLKETLASLQADADEAIEALRDLARGIYPPLLAEQGLAVALEGQAQKLPAAVEIREDGVSRYAQDVEAAVYFCCLEALQNVAKYAAASRAVVHLAEADGELRFSVSDDGRGFEPAAVERGSGLQNMADRLEVLGESLEVTSSPRGGTTVRGRLPIHARAAGGAQRGA